MTCINAMRCVLDTMSWLRRCVARAVRRLRCWRGAAIGTDLLANVALALEYEATCQLAEHRLAAGLAPDQVEPLSSMRCWRW